MKGATYTRWTRVALAGQVLLMVVLAVAAAMLVIEASQTPGARLRYDATFDSGSSLDQGTVDVLAALDSAEIDLFYRPTARGGEALREAFTRMRALLTLAEDQVPGKLTVRYHDANDLARAEARMQEIGVTARDLSYPTPLGTWLAAMVVKVGERRTVARMVPDICTIFQGDPERGVPASVQSFHGESALAEALGRVAGADAPVVYVVAGAAEMTLEAGQQGGIGDLTVALGNEGFVVGSWDPAVDPAVPSGADILVLAGPEVSYTSAAAEEIERFVLGGGALFGCIGASFVNSSDGLPDLMARFGQQLVPGLVCHPFFDPGYRRYTTGDVRCAEHWIYTANLSASHPVTVPLRTGSAPVASFYQSRSIERAEVPEGGTFVDLVRTDENSWRDVVTQPPFSFDEERERSGRFTLMAATEWTGPSAKRSRVIGLAAAFPLAQGFEFNRDLLINAFEWLADRDYRVRMRPRQEFRAELGEHVAGLTTAVKWTGWFGFPALCVVIGGFLALRRRR
ncbi:ABC-type uncharacterized transport system [Planctomycetes bacterium Pla163]|uniref:ABC-type uncharacterized transport system n=1 Tax=Rohdeia mirabilis TaxID=2528008 RepID=A0A518CZY9_9BACT|nr:ABC-type uncharacterized transport system [Planctomycetes bacterium Pla163]